LDNKVLFWIIIGVAVFFRCYRLASIPGINGDEAWLGYKAWSVAHGEQLNWTTNSGNLTDPFYIIPLILVHKIWLPSPVILRSIAVISGILVLPVNYLFCQWVYETKSALASTLLLAVLPVNIVYSRFGWEPSQSVLFAIPCLYIALAVAKGKIGTGLGLCLLFISMGAAFAVHPTNFYLAGFAIALTALLTFYYVSNQWCLIGYVTILIAGFMALGGVAILKAPPGVHEEIIARISSWSFIKDVPLFLFSWLRFYNGINSTIFIMGSWVPPERVLSTTQQLWVAWPDLLAMACFLICTFSLLWEIVPVLSQKSASVEGALARTDLTLLTGLVGSSILFDLLNGPVKLAVYNDRYGLWMVPAGVLILVRGAIRMMEIKPSLQRLITITGILVCLLLLAETYYKYFDFGIKTGGRSGMDARVGDEDLKLAAAKLISESSSATPQSAPLLISSNWFVYWAILYFLKSDGDAVKWITMLIDVYPHTYSTESQGIDMLEAVKNKRVVFADFSDSFAWKIWDAMIHESGVSYDKHEYLDCAGNPVLLLKVPHQR
jgi:hypothetical protein